MIILETSKATINFEELKEGDIFDYDGSCFIKTHRIDAIGTHSKVNAVRLLDGMAYSFSQCDEVTPIKDYDFTVRW